MNDPTILNIGYVEQRGGLRRILLGIQGARNSHTAFNILILSLLFFRRIFIPLCRGIICSHDYLSLQNRGGTNNYEDKSPRRVLGPIPLFFGQTQIYELEILTSDAIASWNLRQQTPEIKLTTIPDRN